MNIETYIGDFFKTVITQDAIAMRSFFAPDATVRWHNTNEQFLVDEYIRANCEYPGKWNGEIVRLEQSVNSVIMVAHVYSTKPEVSFHVTTFYQIENDKIQTMDEYWGDDGNAPQWRQDKHIGTSIQ